MRVARSGIVAAFAAWGARPGAAWWLLCKQGMATNIRDTLEKMLRRRRGVLLREATEREVALRDIGAEGESDLADAAQDDQMDRELALLDDRARGEIDEINAALDRLADGNYGRCAQCDEPIDLDRLTVLPETAVCVRCASALEAAHAIASPVRAPAGEVSPDPARLSDREMEALIRETVEDDECIDDEELRISCRHGVVHLDGVLPSNGERIMVRRIVEDVLGFRDVVDDVRIARCCGNAPSVPESRSDVRSAASRRGRG